jgi:hypothetical protein
MISSPPLSQESNIMILLGVLGALLFFLMSIYYDNKGQRFMEKHRPDGKKIIGISTDQ